MRPRIPSVVTGSEIEQGDHVTIKDRRVAVLAVRPQTDATVILVLKANGWPTPRTAVVNAAARITVQRLDPYIRARFINRLTHAEVEVIDAAHPDTEFLPDDMGDEPPNRWYTVCRTHSTLCSHPTLSLAMGHAAEPDGWCEACRDLLQDQAKGA